MKRIVLGYGASPAAERAFQRVVELARALDASVIVAPFGSEDDEWAQRRSAGEPAREETAVARLNGLGIPARVAAGPTYTGETLRELAESTAADMLVVGINGTRDGTVWGGAACDVLLVH
jgi:nucleotide-binding universal stress UspA family protein